MLILRSLLVSLLFGSLISGCGFHLRNRSSSPWPVELYDIHIRMANQYEERTIYYMLRNKLELDSPAKVYAVATKQTVILLLKSEKLKRHVLSVDPTTVKVRSYLLRYSLSYELRDFTGAVVMPLEKIVLQRDYEFLQDDVLAGEVRRDDLIRSLREEAVIRLVQRLRHFKPLSKKNILKKNKLKKKKSRKNL